MLRCWSLPWQRSTVSLRASGSTQPRCRLPWRPLFNPAVQGFLISAFALDPAKLAGQVKKPMLIVQGERDIQVSVADAEALKAANPSASLLLLPDTNHVLKQVTSDQMGANVATYADPSLPLAPGIADAIARFVAKPQN
jgi:fermentation-respiration switch protein FrsA (DUF1100 family)